MAVDAIRSTERPALPAASPIRAKPAPVSADNGRAPAPATRPAPVQAAEEVRLQWDADYGVVVKFTDAKSGEVLRQIPSDQILGIVRFIRQMLQEEGAGHADAGQSQEREGL